MRLRSLSYAVAVFVGAFAVLLFVAIAGTTAGAQDGKPALKDPSQLMWTGPSIVVPVIDSKRGRRLFATKGCVICHAINGVGGDLGPELDAAADVALANPFDFAARMFRGAEMMIALQQKELGYQIDLNGRDLADIIGFVYDRDEQSQFSDADIPESVRQMMHQRDL